MTITKQVPSDKHWKDEAGNQIPYSRITASERMMEKDAYKIASAAMKLNASLKDFKLFIKTCSDQAYAAFLADNGEKSRKGNYTWHNFDRSIRIEVSVQDRIEFDEMTIGLCKDKLMEFIGSNITGSDEFIKGLVLSAFETSRGKLDTKKVLSLKTHQSRIKDKRYHEAMQLLDKAIRRPDSCIYYRIWVKDEKGTYKAIDLNFSSI